MFKRLMLVGLFAISVVTVTGIEVSARVRNTGGSFFYCPPGTDLNGDGVADCSYNANFSWRGGTPGDAVSFGQVAVTKGFLICDNNGTAFKVTLPGKGTVSAIDEQSFRIETGAIDDNGNFTTSAEFLNRVQDFLTLQDFRDYWGLVGNQCRNKTMTEVEIRIQELVLTGQVGTKCAIPGDFESCPEANRSQAVFTCSTTRPFDEAVVVYTCK